MDAGVAGLNLEDQIPEIKILYQWWMMI